MFTPSYPLMIQPYSSSLHPNLLHARQGRILGKGRMRGGNYIQDLGRSGLNILSSNDRKSAALNELKGWNNRLRQNRTISGFLKRRGWNKVGNLASMAGYGRRRYRRRMRGRNIFKKIFGGIKKGVSAVTGIVRKPFDLAMEHVGAPLISYGVRKIIGGRRRYRRYKRRITRPRRRRQRGGFFPLTMIAGPLIKKALSAAAGPVLNKAKSAAINLAKREGQKLLSSLGDKLSGSGRQRYRRRYR